MVISEKDVKRLLCMAYGLPEGRAASIKGKNLADMEASIRSLARGSELHAGSMVDGKQVEIR